ncbi:MAG TPA: aconitate hydratase AcnA, partial [Gillisia sp.]|nr:aconitate hydratase AcnA [Gillisia sp.]
DRQENRWLAEGGSQTEFTEQEKHISPDAEVDTVNSLRSVKIKFKNAEYQLSDGSIVIAAITSCTNTSNPTVMIGAGLVARKALSKGLRTKSWVKTSLAPGSKVVTTYLDRSGLSEDLDALRFHTVGYGCTSCIGNSGPLPQHIADAVEKNELIVASVLSGNRNFEARVHPQVKMNFLMSPMLVVAYALVGRVDIDLINDPLGYDPNGLPVYLKDIWPTQEEINQTIKDSMRVEDFKEVYDVIFEGEEQWKKLPTAEGNQYIWEENSTYIKEVPFFKDLSGDPEPVSDIENARVLLYLGDSVTTDHISPAGGFNETSAAGKYLISKGVEKKDFNSYGSRRGNHEVMMRGTFANVRIKNRITDKEGGYSTYFPTNETMTVYDAAMKYIEDKTPLIIIAGKEYGSGSSRDWAAKGTNLLGVKVVLAVSFERIHRSNLMQMGVLPLEFIHGENAGTYGITGKEKFSFSGLAHDLTPGKTIRVTAMRESGEKFEFDTVSRLDSAIEVAYYQNGGILQYILRDFLKKIEN